MIPIEECSIDDCLEDMEAHLEKIGETGGAIVLTEKRERQGVILAPDTYKKMVSLIEAKNTALPE